MSKTRFLLLPKRFFLREVFGSVWTPQGFWREKWTHLQGLASPLWSSLKRSHQTSPRVPRRNRVRHFCLEVLDDRTMPSTFVVGNTNNSGAGSLRQAILDANASPGYDIIDFNITGSGVHTITPTSALPRITTSVLIDGTSEPGYTGTPLIEINGASAGNGANGLTLSGGSSTITGLAIDQFASGVGIWIDTTGGDTVTANYIGLNAAGTAAANKRGIWIDSVGGNTIGGTTAAARNVISGNSKDGVYLVNAGAADNLVEGNYIGTDVSGTTAIGNGHGVIILNGAADNTIGGTTAGARNVISGNIWEAVILDGSATTGNVLQGNYIGVDASGTTALGNGLTGVLFQNNASDNTVGGTTGGAANIIANDGYSGDRHQLGEYR